MSGAGGGPDGVAARAAMVEALRGHVRRPAVAEALAAVPRHVFLPGVALAEAYDPRRAVVTKWHPTGAAMSSASAPAVVALMLDQLDVHPGHRVLEIGTGTGWNAALLARLAGPDGTVVSVDIDADCTTRAREALSAARTGAVEVLTGDGLLGAPGHGTFDRIVVTAGAWDVPPAWTAQLVPGGRLVLPLRWRGQTRSVALVHGPDGVLRSDDLALCGFIPLVGPDGERRTPLAADAAAVLVWDHDQSVDAATLAGALDEPGVTAWSGVRVDAWQPVDRVWLRLTVEEPGAVGVLADTARLAFPLQRSQGVVEGASLGALILRGHDGGVELGARGYGPDGSALAERVLSAVARWDVDRTGLPALALHPAGTPDDRLPAGPVVEKVHRRLVASYASRSSNSPA